MIEEKCTGCNICVEYCPVRVPDTYNQNISTNKAIHIHFSQALPLIPYVDPDACLYLEGWFLHHLRRVCKAANRSSPGGRDVEVKVGAIVLSPGFETFDPKLRSDYGYGIYENVVTSLDYEQILSSTSA